MAASKCPSIYQDFIPPALHNAATKPKIRIDYIERGKETEYTYTLIWHRNDGKTNTTILNPCKTISICDENNQKRPMIFEMKKMQKKKSRKSKQSGSRKRSERKKAQLIEEPKEILKTATMNETQPINSHISYPSSTVTLSTASQPLSRPSLPTDNKKIPVYHISKDQSGASNLSYAYSIKNTKRRPKKKKKCSSKSQKKSTPKSKKKIPSRVLLKLKIIKDIINQPVFEAHYNYRTILHDAIDEMLKRNNEPRLLLKTYRVGQLVLYGSDDQRPLNYEEYFCRSVGELREKDGIVYITVNLDK